MYHITCFISFPDFSLSRLKSDFVTVDEGLVELD